MRKKKKTYTTIIAKAICDRKFDIPDWMYEYINIDVVDELLPMVTQYLGLPKVNLSNNSTEDKSMEPYTIGSNINDFFNRVKKKINIGGISADIIYSTGDGIFAGLLLNKKGWRRVRTIVQLESIDNYSRNKFINLITKYLLSSENLFDQTKMILNTVGLKKEYVVESVYNKLKSYPEIDCQERMFRLINILGVCDNYKLTQYCLNLGVPVFFSDGDITDLYKYLSVFIESGWKHGLDRGITNVHVTGNDKEILGNMVHIAKYLNHSAAILAKEMITDPLIFEENFDKSTHLIDNLLGTSVDNNPIYGVNDFTELVSLFGNNLYGIPIPAQIKFIVNGGNIKTMFTDEGRLLPEASIIKTSDQIDYIVNHISVEDLRFLIYNSTDFVKNIISNNNITMTSCIKILKALFEYPINESLWIILNKPDYSDGIIDFRETIVRKAISLITLDAVFINVPEAMLYIEPSALFVTRNLSKENIPFIPITKLIPYLPSIISQNDYIKFNRFCSGNYVSITHAVTLDIVTKMIVDYKKYGYLGDIEGTDHKQFMDTYM